MFFFFYEVRAAEVKSNQLTSKYGFWFSDDWSVPGKCILQYFTYT
jgi:hypothetical protein